MYHPAPLDVGADYGEIEFVGSDKLLQFAIPKKFFCRFDFGIRVAHNFLGGC
jgi:hypothetical protein